MSGIVDKHEVMWSELIGVLKDMHNFEMLSPSDLIRIMQQIEQES